MACKNPLQYINHCNKYYIKVYMNTEPTKKIEKSNFLTLKYSKSYKIFK